MVYSPSKIKILIGLVLITNSAISQDYLVHKIDSCNLLEKRNNTTHFSQLVDLASSSSLQILFIQLDNPNRSKAESYYLKIDSNNKVYKCTFTEKAIKSELQCSFATQYFGFIEGLTNDIKGVTTTRHFDGIQTPSYLVIKCKNIFSKLFFFNTDIQPALKSMSELKSQREALEFLKTQFKIKFYKMLDG